MATKRGKDSRNSKAKRTTMVRTTDRKPPASKPAARAAAKPPPPRPLRTGSATDEAPLLERAERLRVAILQSKLTAVDPWGYATKARRWSQRAQDLVDDLNRSGDSPVLARGLDTLRAEVEADADYQEARRRT